MFQIVLIEGAFARPQVSQYVPDGRQFLLTIRSSTKLHCLFKAKPEEEDNDMLEDVEPKPYESIAEISKCAVQDELISKLSKYLIQKELKVNIHL